MTSCCFNVTADLLARKFSLHSFDIYPKRKYSFGKFGMAQTCTLGDVMRTRNDSDNALSACIFCPRPIGPDDARVLIYIPKNPPGHQVARSHVTCCEQHPLQYLNLMKRVLGLVDSHSFVRQKRARFMLLEVFGREQTKN
ncbi:hypothetical protein A3A36_02370 [Candidatus Kaiserbacteria bacterium RIFCSPLOWO2_01_FULL_52_12b]|uniref:Uncharacterized protein n=1 Tax=Candidatus Kaiserbacteria bacterium RIFCSPLOWO2_01_FULL_52_12b TaxID=1798509 RepID=A0A1F6EWA2_9BACT|nr:MAG: hypothetical protein A3A36_02370 [Candidatus Kaiserbacteria bacterium RIFCSPLOWO2_01_FULL_52_12b]